MCGLVGVFERNGDTRGKLAAVAKATRTLAHRGPDDEGTFDSGPVALGFRRLAILDLSPLGHQPMTSHDGTWTLVFNGEIYNFIELRRELEAVGAHFRGASDTEVLVEGLARWGIRTFERCNGMWAVLAWHHPTRTLVACRDPWGIKPLFAADQGDWVGFASEIKALRTLGCRLGAVHGPAVRRFLDDGELDVGDRTFYEGVVRLTPGVVHRYREGRPVERIRMSDGTRQVDIPSLLAGPTDDGKLVEAFRDAFREAVQLRLRSDVAVGTCLSGGLDSTAIACAAARLLHAERAGNCRHAFTALIPEYDERRYIQAVVEQTGVTWHTTVADDDQVRADFAGFYRVHDEPVHSLSAFASYLVMSLAHRAGVKVLLNGQGSDELLAGYSSANVPYIRSLIELEGPAYALRQALAEAGTWSGGLRLLGRAAAGHLGRSLPQIAARVPRAVWQRAVVAKDGDDPLRRGGPISPPMTNRERAPLGLHAALEDQVQRAPLPLYLRIEDANSSAFSIEARLPFLDPRLVAIARVAPARMLRHSGLNKYLLRSILPGLVPEVVWRRRDKMGFPVPQVRWLRRTLRSELEQVLAPAQLERRGWYDVPVVAAMVQRFLTVPDSELAPRLQRLFQLEKWAQVHLD
jgi:asparagine synthase (glutamine-hydrolysing)